MRIPKRGIGAAVALAATAALLTGCSGGAQSDPNTLKLWHFEGTDSDVGIAWAKAIEIFEEETGATVEYEDKSFEQIRSTASQVLNSNEAPDVMESPKGNATAGLLASQGLLADITDAVEEYGWDDLLAPSLQTTAKYDEDGIMGSGPWYGVPNYGEYVTVYYNKTAFDELGLSVPTTYDEFEEVLDAFVAAGQTPIAEAGAEYPLGQLFYQLALTQADRQFVNDYQLYENPVDWQGEALTYAADKVVEYVDKGWISADSTGLKAEDMGVGFMSGEYPIMVSGSWWAGRVINEATTFEWDTFLFPGADLVPGSVGQHLGRARERGQQGTRVRVHRHHHASRDPGPHRQQRLDPRRRRPGRHHRREVGEAHHRLQHRGRAGRPRVLPRLAHAELLRPAGRRAPGARERHAHARADARAARRRVRRRRRRHHRMTRS